MFLYKLQLPVLEHNISRTGFDVHLREFSIKILSRLKLFNIVNNSSESIVKFSFVSSISIRFFLEKRFLVNYLYK